MNIIDYTYEEIKYNFKLVNLVNLDNPNPKYLVPIYISLLYKEKKR